MAMLALGLAACRDDRPLSLAPAPSGRWLSAAIRCDVKPGERQASCGTAVVGTGASRGDANRVAAARLLAAQSRPSGGTMNAVVFGGQEEQVRLTVRDVRASPAGDTTRVTFILRNLLAQPLGTTNLTSADPNGVQLFVANGPAATAGAGGTVTVTDLTDSSAFPPFSGRRPYAQLPGLMLPGASVPFMIGFAAPLTVTGFTFDLLVSTELGQPSAQGGPQHTDQLSVSSAGTHACVVAEDLNGNSGNPRAWCWGRGAGLGVALDTASSVPLPVEGYRFRAIDAWGPTRCGLSVEGLVYCWGAQTAYSFALDASTEPRPTMPGIRLTQFAISESHICGVATDSTAWCRGDNTNGQLGNPAATGFAPVQVSGGLKWREVRVGDTFSCGLVADSTAYCWGANVSGQLGDGTVLDRLSPRPVLGNLRWKTLRLGAEFSCGVDRADQLYCWGSNAFGQVGNNALGTDATQPQVVALASGFNVLAVGGYSACATRVIDTYCWGLNQTSNLGNATPGSYAIPAQLNSGSPYTELSIARGSVAAHSCGRAGSIVECWGQNQFGQLGNQSPGAPLADPVRFTGIGAVSALSTGVDGTCVIETTPAGRVSCLGNNDQGELARRGSGTFVGGPVAVSEAFEVAAGGSHTCVTLFSAFCWGRGAEGQLGNGGAASSQVPVAVSGSASFHGISAGANHTCALGQAQKTACWGDNSSGQIGEGTVGGTLATPRDVTDSAGAVRTGLVSLTAGVSHNCGLDNLGVAYCWGRNADGDLGVGVAGLSRPFAAPVSGGLFFRSISAGLNATCGVTLTNELYCWGSAVNGIPGPNFSTTPLRIASPLKWASVSVGFAHACALTVGGYAYCWGTNGVGELGIDVAPPFRSSFTPLRVINDIQFSTISAGQAITCAIELKVDGGPWCWGASFNLGLGATQRIGPQKIDLPVKKRQDPNGLP